MGQEVRGVVSKAKGSPVTVETIVVPDPGPGEAVVARQGVRRVPHRPALPRGRHQRRLPLPARATRRPVWSSPSGRTSPTWRPGDFVVLNWRAVCGECRSCRRGRPWYCFATHNATQKMTLADGTPLSPALGIGAFADKTLVAAGPVHQGQPGGPARGGRAARAAA